tara:strand:+ start:103 stop:1803 length:1701 start_codon:yes stop_codon:yes gene_type:complete
MKKYLFSIVVFFICFNCLSQTDTICNPSFEDSLNSWGVINNGSATSSLLISSDSLHSGSFGLIYDVSYVNPPSSSCALTSCLLNLQQGNFYKISFWAKSDSLESLLVVLQPTSAPFTNYASKTFITSSNWQQFTLYTSDSNAVSNLKIKVKPQTSGVYYFDDFLMESVSSLPTISNICNADFENGLSDWTQSPNGGVINVLSESINVQNGVSSAKITTSNTTSGQPIFSSCKSDIQKNIKYKIIFWMKSEIGGENVVATSSLSSSPFTNYGQLSINLTNVWTEYSFIIESDTTIYSNVRLAKFKFFDDGIFYLDNISIEEVPPQPIFCDGDFETDLSNWTQTINNGAIASISITPSQAQNGFQSAMILLNTPGTTNSSVQLSSCTTDGVKDSIYKISFWVKGSAANLNFNAITSLSDSPYTAISSNSFQTTTDWTEYCYDVEFDSTIIDGIRLLKLQFLNAGTYYIDNVTIQDNTYNCSTPIALINDISKDLKIWPNPVRENFNISSKNIRIKNLFVYDIYGKRILFSKVNNYKYLLDISSLNNGTYFIQINLESGDIIKRKILVL